MLRRLGGRHRERVGVVGGHRPEGVDRREFAFIEMEDVVAVAVERSAFAVNRKRGIDGILRQVFAETAIGDGGAIGSTP